MKPVGLLSLFNSQLTSSAVTLRFLWSEIQTIAYSRGHDEVKWGPSEWKCAPSALQWHCDHDVQIRVGGLGQDDGVERRGRRQQQRVGRREEQEVGRHAPLAAAGDGHISLNTLAE